MPGCLGPFGENGEYLDEPNKGEPENLGFLIGGRGIEHVG